MTRSFVLPAAGNGTPQSTNRKRLMAEAMLAQSMGYEPIASPWQGANKLAQALMGGLIGMRADKMDAQGREGANNALIRALTGGKTVHQGDDPTGAMVQGINDPYQSDIGQRMLYDKWQQDNTPPDPNAELDLKIKQLQYEQMQQPDPTKALQIEKMKLELEQMRNPQAEYRPATPQEKQQWGVAPDAPLVIGKDGKPSILSDGKTTVNVGGGSDKQIFDETKARADAARSAYTGLTSLDAAGKALPGAITGAMANERLALQKIGSLFGMGDTGAIQDTETFRSAMAQQVGSMLKLLVGGVQISNADREFAEKAAAGDITLDRGSIERLLDIQKQIQSQAVRSFNRDLGAVYPEGQGFDRERALFNVPQVPHYGPRQGPPTREGQMPDYRPQVQQPMPSPELGGVPSPSLNPIGSANAQGKGDMQRPVPPEAVAELMADPSPQTIAEFDAVFGQGAAARIMQGQR